MTDAEVTQAYSARPGRGPGLTLITRRGEPIAEVTPPSPEHAREDWLGSAAGTGQILGDIVSPIASEDWEALGK